MFSMRLARTLLPLEYLCCQGVPVFGLVARRDSTPAFGVIRLALSDALSDTEVCQLAGNGMHLAAIGAVMLHVITSVQWAGCD